MVYDKVAYGPENTGGTRFGWRSGGKTTLEKSRVLGKCSEMSKGQAETIMASILDPLNERVGKRQPRAFTFKEYVEDVYLPVCRRKWKESTRMTSEPTITFHLLPPFASTPIADITRDAMQVFLDKMAQTHSTSVVGHLRWHLSGIFKMALGDGAVGLNPTVGLYTPACKPAAEKRVMCREEIIIGLETLNLRETLIFRMASSTASGQVRSWRFGWATSATIRFKSISACIVGTSTAQRAGNVSAHVGP